MIVVCHHIIDEEQMTKPWFGYSLGEVLLSEKGENPKNTQPLQIYHTYLVPACPPFWNQRELDEDYVGLLTHAIEEEGMSPFLVPMALIISPEYVSSESFLYSFISFFFNLTFGSMIL